MSEAQDAPAVAPKVKKSVALSGVIAGNTALCTVGRTGNDLHYRGYDILDVAEACEFEEIAHLLVHGKLPNASRAGGVQDEAEGAARPAGEREGGARVAARIQPSDGRDAHRRLGARLRAAGEGRPQRIPGAKDIADRLMASLGSMLLYWYHYSTNGRRIEVETDDDSIGGHFLHLLHGRPPSELWVRAMHTSLILYAEHEFNASTFTGRVIAGTGSDIYSAITGAIGALRGPKHGGANEAGLRHPEALRHAGRGRSRHPPPRRGEGSDHSASAIRSTRFPTRAIR